jgi:hypothetical protein
LFSIVWTINGKPPEWLDSITLPALTYIAIIGGGLFVMAPGYPPEALFQSVALWGANRKLLVGLGLAGGIIAFCISLYTGAAV